MERRVWDHLVVDPLQVVKNQGRYWQMVDVTSAGIAPGFKGEGECVCVSMCVVWERQRNVILHANSKQVCSTVFSICQKKSNLKANSASSYVALPMLSDCYDNVIHTK